MKFLILKWEWKIEVYPLWLSNTSNPRWTQRKFKKTLGLCHLCIEEANLCDETVPQQMSHLRSGLVLVGMSGAGVDPGLTCH